MDFVTFINVAAGITTIVVGIITLYALFIRGQKGTSQPLSPPYRQQPMSSPVPQPYANSYPLDTSQAYKVRRRRISYPRLAVISVIGILAFAITLFLAISVPHVDSSFSLLALAGLIVALISTLWAIWKTISLHQWWWFAAIVAINIASIFILAIGLGTLIFAVWGPTEQHMR